MADGQVRYHTALQIGPEVIIVVASMRREEESLLILHLIIIDTAVILCGYFALYAGSCKNT